MIQHLTTKTYHITKIHRKCLWNLGTLVFSESVPAAMASKTSNAESDAAKVATLTEEVPHGDDAATTRF